MPHSLKLTRDHKFKASVQLDLGPGSGIERQGAVQARARAPHLATPSQANGRSIRSIGVLENFIKFLHQLDDGMEILPMADAARRLECAAPDPSSRCSNARLPDNGHNAPAFRSMR